MAEKADGTATFLPYHSFDDHNFSLHLCSWDAFNDWIDKSGFALNIAVVLHIANRNQTTRAMVASPSRPSTTRSLTMAGTSASEADSDMVRRYNVARSCIRCHQRKIRCDKGLPCAACVKAGDRPGCRYPAGTKAKRRAAKADGLQLQIERLERLVADRINQPPARNTHSDHQSSSSAATVGVLVKDGHYVRYINDQVLSHIFEKVRMVQLYDHCELVANNRY